MVEISEAKIAVLETRIEELARRVSALENTTRDDSQRIEARMSDMASELGKLATAVATLTVKSTIKNNSNGHDHTIFSRIFLPMIYALLSMIGALAGVKIAFP